MLPLSWQCSRLVFCVHSDEGLLIVLRTEAVPCRLSFGAVAEGASVRVDSVTTLVVNHSTLRSDAKTISLLDSSISGVGRFFRFPIRVFER